MLPSNRLVRFAISPCMQVSQCTRIQIVLEQKGDDATTTAPQQCRVDCPAAAILDKLMPCPTEPTHPLWGAPLLAEVPAARILWACGHVWACGAGDSEH